MSIVLCHESALRYWLTKTSDECVPDVIQGRSLANASASMREIKAAPLPFGFSADRPLHVLVGSRLAQRNQLRVRVHTWSGPIPSNSFYELAGPCLVSSPEFVFVQMAFGASLVCAVTVGCYLCGCFAMTDDGKGYAGQRMPLTTPDNIRDFISGMPGAAGTRRALDALEYVVANTASPREVELATASVLPPGLGGWGFPDVVANEPIEVPPHLRGFAGADQFCGDLYFPAIRCDMEYDSNRYHSGSFRLDHTMMRRNVLEAAGIRTISATAGQLRTFTRFSTFMEMARARFGLSKLDLGYEEVESQRLVYDYYERNDRQLF